MFVYEEELGIHYILDHFLDSNIERSFNILEQAGYRIHPITEPSQSFYQSHQSGSASLSPMPPEGMHQSQQL